MARWNMAFKGGLKADKRARARINHLRSTDPAAWAYFDCHNDADTCPECAEAAVQLERVPLRDPRLMVMLRGHPNCTSPQGCRCAVVAVAGDEPGPAPR